MQTIQRQLREDGICVLTFDRPESPANIFDLKTLEELDAHLQAIAEPNLGAKGLVILSSKPTIFIAGADLKGIQRMDPEQLRVFISLGQQAIARLAALPIPTVAAIHGACVGGGYEIALACDWRVASTDRSTKIGLPETKLGILPAWGGSTRLPKLIGLPAALDIILGGKTLAPKAALKKGLVDALTLREHLLTAALEELRKGKRKPEHSWLAGAVTAPIVAAKARSMLMAKTRGKYPALTKALEVVVKAFRAHDETTGLALERDAVLELAASPIARRLIGLFFQQERARKLEVPAAGRVLNVKHAAIIGAGLMGSGIAQWLSAKGIHVILRDVDETRVAAGMANIAKLYAKGRQRHTFTEMEVRDGLDRISPAPNEVPLRRADLVIEAAVEKMEVKKTIFRRLDDLTREDAILATNTSALSIAELAAATRHPARVVGLHFFNPVHQMQLVEVVVSPHTAPEVAQGAMKFAQKIGKLPVLVKDSPGFVVNRILLPYMIEAGELFWSGVSAHDIDEAMLDFGMPMGPLRLTDEVGVVVAEDVAQTLATAFPKWMRVPRLLPRMIESGLLGRGASKGFYLYKSGAETKPNHAAEELHPPAKVVASKEELQQRLVLLMVNEAARCLEEKIVESAGDIDFAMVMGTGFAPFTGGPLRYADSVGTAKIAQQLSALADTAGSHYAPCALLAELARTDAKFYED
jgi:3-hydroxyacyl-CoA dehydrogenase/enoyl-CoA hydratase/3-hydroxybutyryl-CoA epimerase